MLRKIYTISTLIFLSWSTFSSASGSDTLSINFNGTIGAASCDVNSGETVTVPLGDVSKSVFENPGSMSDSVEFGLFINCSDGGPTEATVTFEGIASADPKLLAIDNEGQSGAASGIAVRITAGNKQIDLNTPSLPYGLASGWNELMFAAQYESLVERSNIVAGKANATAQFTINYP